MQVQIQLFPFIAFLFVGVLTMRALRFGVYTRALIFGNFHPRGAISAAKGSCSLPDTWDLMLCILSIAKHHLHLLRLM